MPSGRKAHAKGDETKTSFITRADLLLSQGEYSQAASEYTKHIERHPDSIDALVKRSQCFLKLGLAESALIDAQLAVEINEKLDAALSAKAEALMEMERFEEALTIFSGLFANASQQDASRDLYKRGLRRCLERTQPATFQERGGAKDEASTETSSSPPSTPSLPPPPPPPPLEVPSGLSLPSSPRHSRQNRSERDRLKNVEDIENDPAAMAAGGASKKRVQEVPEVGHFLQDERVHNILFDRSRKLKLSDDAFICEQRKIDKAKVPKPVKSSIIPDRFIPAFAKQDTGPSLFGIREEKSSERQRSIELASPPKRLKDAQSCAGLDALFVRSLSPNSREQLKQKRGSAKVQRRSGKKKVDEYFFFQDENRVCLDHILPTMRRSIDSRKHALEAYRSRAFKSLHSLQGGGLETGGREIGFGASEASLARLNGGGGYVLCPADGTAERQKATATRASSAREPRPRPPPRRPASAFPSSGRPRTPPKRRLVSATKRRPTSAVEKEREVVRAWSPMPHGRMEVAVETTRRETPSRQEDFCDEAMAKYAVDWDAESNVIEIRSLSSDSDVDSDDWPTFPPPSPTERKKKKRVFDFDDFDDDNSDGAFEGRAGQRTAPVIGLPKKGTRRASPMRRRPQTARERVQRKVEERAKLIPMGRDWLSAVLKRERRIPDDFGGLTLRDRIKSSLDFLHDS